MRTLLMITAVSLLAAGLMPWTAAQGSPSPSETMLFEDTPGDYALPAPYLDIVAVHATERYRYDFERRQEIGTAAFIRVETAGMTDFQQSLVARYHVFGQVNGSSAFELWADVTRNNDGQLQVQATGPNNDASVSQTSVTLIAPYEAIGVSRGSAVTGIWAATSTAGGDGARTFQDVAPHDNQGLPAVSADSPPSETGSYVMSGPFPYVALIQKTPLERFSAEGAKVDFRFDVVTAEGVSGEIVRFYFQVPEGWDLEPSRGETTPQPVGELTNVNHPASIEFVVSMTAKGVPEMNSTATAVMDMISTSGAHERLELTAIVTGPKLASEDYEFQLLSGTSYSAGDASRLEFAVAARDGSLPDGTRVKVDFFQQGRLVETADAAPAEEGNGTYVAEYAFPSEGLWVADVYLANMRPSPHEEFPVTVSSGGFLPGPGAPVVVAMLALAFFAATRRRVA